MSNIRKALEKENISERKIKEVLNHLGIKDSKRWVPEIGEEYWTTHRYGIRCYKWTGDEVDLYLKLTGSMFKTEQEAQHHLDKINFLAKMKNDFEDNSDDIDWDCGQIKYHIYRQNDELRIGVARDVHVSGALYTTNKEWLKQYISENEAEIKKYCFGIE